MNLQNLMDEIAALGPSERRRLIGYAIALGDAETPAYRQTLTERIDDRDPKNWATLEDLDKY